MYVKQEENLCHICDNEITSDNFELHFLNAHSSKSKCNLCNETFTEKELKIHIIKIHDKNIK